METRKEQRDRHRSEILNVALDLFVRKGYAATKVADITGEAKISTGLFFHYFESKEKIYEELIKMGLEGVAYPTNQKFDHAMDFFEKITEALFAYMRKEPMVAKMFALMSAAQRSDATPDYIREMANKGISVIEQFVPVVLWGQKEGTIREGDPLAISNAFWCSIQGIAEQYAANPQMTLPDPDWMVDIVRSKHV